MQHHTAVSNGVAAVCRRQSVTSLIQRQGDDDDADIDVDVDDITVRRRRRQRLISIVSLTCLYVS